MHHTPYIHTYIITHHTSHITHHTSYIIHHTFANMKIYTKTGDNGSTGLIGGTCVSKSDVRLEAYGTLDELNSHIGLLAAYCKNEEQKAFLQNIQNLLFTVGSSLATDTTKTDYKTASVMKPEYVEAIEKEIDRMNEQLEPLCQFTIPGGSLVAAQSHICRTVARRAERRIVEMAKTYPVEDLIVKYVNRLSDYFFVLARKLLMDDKTEEIVWKQPQ